MTIRKAMDTTISRTTYCYSYQRISSKKQLKGSGINRQVEASVALCEQNGWRLDTSFHLTDIGKSAFHGKHLDDKAALGGFLKAVDEGLIKRPAVLLVESLDRLSRENIMDALELFIRILNTGITIYTSIDRVTYNREDIKTNFGPLIISITILCRAHEESLIKAERTKKSWKHQRKKIASGEIGHKNIYPWWIDISSGKPLVIESKAKMVREMFYLCTEKNLSYAMITETMVKKYGKELQFSPTTLKRLFSSKKVLGIYEPAEIFYTDSGKRLMAVNEEINAYPAIIDEKTFYAAQAAIKGRIIKASGRPSKNRINFFKSMLACECGGAYVMAASGKKRDNVYRCNDKYRYRECNNKTNLMVYRFQPVLLKAIAVIDKDDMLVSASNTKQAKLSKELAGKQAELLDKQTRMDNLAELVAAGSNKGVQMVVELEKDIESIHQEIAAIQDQLDMLASPTMAASIEHINAFHQRFQLEKATIDDHVPFIEALQNTIEKIVIHSPEKEGQRTIAVIHLLSGIRIRVEVFKDYTAYVYKGRKCILRIDDRK